MNLSLQQLNLSSLGSVEAYIQMVNRLPLLKAAEERNLALQYSKNNDLSAARELIVSQLRYVVRIAKGYLGYGLALADLIQEGNIGLMKAVKRFDPQVGVRLITFAVHWIKAEIHEFILKNWRIVKVATTKAQRKLFFKLRASKHRLGWFTKAEAAAVAKDLGVTTKVVHEMEARMSGNDTSFEATVADDDETLAPVTYLEDHRYNPAEQVEQLETASGSEKSLQLALATLDARSQNIVTQRWLAAKKATLHELADFHQVSAERIRQIEQNGDEKVTGSDNRIVRQAKLAEVT